MLLHLQFGKLAARDANAAMDQLFCAFPDHYPILESETSDFWTFALEWPKDPQWYIDPGVCVKAQALFGLTLEEIPSFYAVEKCGRADFVLSMLHSRALLAPALAARRLKDYHRVHIIHVDDHDDLMAPLLTRTSIQDELVNSTLCCCMKLADPESVNLAIDRGAVAKGSFLTAFLLMNSRSGILFHIRENMEDADSWLVPLPMDFDLGNVRFERTGVDFCETESAAGWRFKQRHALPQDFEREENDRVWLDVDLDAFCNRYDGDSDNRFKPGCDSEREEMWRRVEAFLVQLQDARWISNIEAVSVAISPSFFPSEYWGDVIPRLCSGIKAVICRS